MPGDDWGRTDLRREPFGFDGTAPGHYGIAIGNHIIRPEVPHPLAMLTQMQQLARYPFGWLAVVTMVLSATNVVAGAMGARLAVSTSGCSGPVSEEEDRSEDESTVGVDQRGRGGRRVERATADAPHMTPRSARQRQSNQVAAPIGHRHTNGNLAPLLL